jgi:hypothetical protein
MAKLADAFMAGRICKARRQHSPTVCPIYRMSLNFTQYHIVHNYSNMWDSKRT